MPLLNTQQVIQVTPNYKETVYSCVEIQVYGVWYGVR